MPQAPPAIVYLDHASTSWPKPPGVLAAIRARLGDRSPLPPADVDELCRHLRTLSGADEETRCRLTCGGRAALRDLLRATLAPGDHVVTTVLDHDAVRDTLGELESSGVRTTLVGLGSDRQQVDVDAFRAALRPGTALAIMPQVSNVTGAVQPVEAIARHCRARDIPLVLDAAQGIGRLPGVFTSAGLAALAASTHKALLGPRRTGFTLLSESFRARLAGRADVVDTAARAALLDLPPDEGLAPALLAGAIAGVRHFLALEASRDINARVAETLAALRSVPGLTLHGPSAPRGRIGIFGFSLAGYDALELAGRLRARGWWVAGGTQRSSWLHEALATADGGGLVRISLGPGTSPAEIDGLTAALITAAGERP